MLKASRFLAFPPRGFSPPARAMAGAVSVALVPNHTSASQRRGDALSVPSASLSGSTFHRLPAVPCSGPFHHSRTLLIHPLLLRLAFDLAKRHGTAYFKGHGQRMLFRFLEKQAREYLKQAEKQQQQQQEQRSETGQGQQQYQQQQETQQTRAPVDLSSAIMTPADALRVLGIDDVNPELVRRLTTGDTAADPAAGPLLARHPKEQEVARDNFNKLMAICIREKHDFLAGKVSAAFRLCVDLHWDASAVLEEKLQLEQLDKSSAEKESAEEEKK